MGPKRKAAAQPAARKQNRKRPRGLLGAVGGYNSESDDFSPTAKRQAKGKGNSRPPVSSEATTSDEADSDVPECSYDSNANSNDSDSGNKSDLGNSKGTVRRQRKTRQKQSSQASSKPQRRGGGKPSSTRNRHKQQDSKDPALAVTSWDHLPTPVLAQIFQAVCRHGALPMAPRLACVCSSWHAVVLATPELWRLLDTAAIPRRAWALPSSASRGGKGKGKRGAGRQQLTAAEGLSHWAASGRLQQLQVLLLYGQNGAGPVAGAADNPATAATGEDVNRQLSSELLMQIADSCQQIRRISLSGVFTLKPEELSSALLSMPGLSQLGFHGVRLSSLTGLGACLCSVLEAAAASDHPRLKELVVEGCLALNQKAVAAMCPSAARHSGGPSTSDSDDEHPSQQQQQEHSSPSGRLPAHSPAAPSAAALPAFSHLEVLDLSRSGQSGRTFKLQLDDLQTAMPQLRVLKLSALGGLYGWSVSVRDEAALPGFPALESLHVDCAMMAPLSGSMKLHPGSSFVNDTVLLQLAGKSCRLEVLDLSGTGVTAAGLRQLAAALAACRLQAPEMGGHAGSLTAAMEAGGGALAAPAGVEEVAVGGSDAQAVQPAVAAAAAEGGLRVKDLRLDGSRLACDEGLLAVGQCCCDTLEQLIVRNAGSRLRDEGIRGLSGCLKLSTLDITGCSVTEQGLSDLLSALPAGVLEELTLDSCRSLNRGARQAAVRGVMQLQEYLADAV